MTTSSVNGTDKGNDKAAKDFASLEFKGSKAQR
jgi:hypothetical protein